MSFVTPRDPDYLRIKRIKQGEFRVDPVYDAFIEGFRERYGVSPLAVLLDTVSQPLHGVAAGRGSAGDVRVSA